VAAAPWLSWSEALKKAGEAIRELIGRIEAAFSTLKGAKRELQRALAAGPDAAEARFYVLMDGVEGLLGDVGRALKGVLAELPDG